ncbi:MAG: 23S rRNA (guanosine(2251)-2'-O)-methyltransferase RlmB [Formosa sp.]|mgnify:FL=1|jgi:23S rRNA (guanosine2251-2'-O)-methyltransferase|nr:23S rRNA (guanosine(2251)-2'-O)-methyltransferase RlmB [Formosa sp.]
MQKETKLYGLRAILEAIEADKSIDKIFLQKGLRSELFVQLEKKIRKKGLNFSYVPVEKLNRLTPNNHQGAVAQISPISFYDLDALVTAVKETKDQPLFLVLDQLSDVRNFGAIIRTAECTGVDGIIIQKKGSAPINGDTIKTSAGAVFNIPICKVDHIKDALYYFQASDIKIIAATEKTENSLYITDFTKGCAIVMGSEGKGISPSVLKIVDAKAKLPMFGNIASLNVSVACGVFLYEVVRQRQSSDL